MKILKKIFGFKFTVYVWAIAIAILVFIGAYFLGVSNSNSKGNQTTESYSMVKYIEKVNQVVFLNVGIQKIDTISKYELDAERRKFKEYRKKDYSNYQKRKSKFYNNL